jgi:uncharacterized membrane protein YkvA (DUF1232 family)
MVSPLPESDCRRPMLRRKVKGISKEQATAIVTKEAEHVTDQDIEKVLTKSEEIGRRFETGGPLGKFVDDFKLLIAIVKDYRRGKYRKIPFWTVAAIVGALLYVLNPLDLIPDFLPLVGQIDDAAVVAACLLMVRQDLHRYKKWKIANPG